MIKKKKWIVVAAGSLLVGFIAFMAFSISIAREAKKIGEYNNPDIQASLEAIRRNPNDAAAHSSAAHYYIGRGSRYDTKAVQELKEVVRIEPQNREAKFLLAYKLNKLNQKSESRKLYQELAQQQDNWGKAAQRHLDKT